ncbi:MAG: hypothetical protein J5I93_05545 [Pirellulaceae bacterium]|nr:hypothetical protein [Pirellulaceae bacterium]
MDLFSLGLPATVALAAVATLGYLFGRQQLRQAAAPPAETHDGLLELQRVANQVRLSLAAHHATVHRFNQSLEQLGQEADPAAALHQLRDQAQQLLHPTRQLSRDLAHAYDELRSHAQYSSGPGVKPSSTTRSRSA